MVCPGIRMMSIFVKYNSSLYEIWLHFMDFPLKFFSSTLYIRYLSVFFFDECNTVISVWFCNCMSDHEECQSTYGCMKTWLWSGKLWHAKRTNERNIGSVVSGMRLGLVTNDIDLLTATFKRDALWNHRICHKDYVKKKENSKSKY